jgi:hypothetical protein
MLVSTCQRTFRSQWQTRDLGGENGEVTPVNQTRHREEAMSMVNHRQGQQVHYSSHQEQYICTIYERKEHDIRQPAPVKIRPNQHDSAPSITHQLQIL